MPTKTLRLAHAEMCDGCADLLDIGTVVLVDEHLHVRCSHCAEGLVALAPVDPWRWIDDPALRDRLQHRHDADQRLLISA